MVKGPGDAGFIARKGPVRIRNAAMWDLFFSAFLHMTYQFSNLVFVIGAGYCFA